MKIVHVHDPAPYDKSFNGALAKQMHDRQLKAVREAKAIAIRGMAKVIGGGCQLFTLPTPKGKGKESKPKAGREKRKQRKGGFRQTRKPR